MDEYQISERRIRPDFKNAAAETEAKMAVWRQKLPEADRISYDDLTRQQDVSMRQLQERQEKMRPALIEQQYKINYHRMFDTARGVGGGGIDPFTIEKRARAAAMTSVQERETGETERADTRNFERRYQFLRDTQARLHENKRSASEKGRAEFARVSGGHER